MANDTEWTGMKAVETTPFILRYEEEPSGESLIDGLDSEYIYDSKMGGMTVRASFVPWDSWLSLKLPEA